jgi:hypothetical protein
MILRPATEAEILYAANNAIGPGKIGDIPVVNAYRSVIEHEGKILAVGGINVMNQWSAFATLALTDDARPYMTIVFRTIREYLDGVTAKCLMATVDPDYEEGKRLVEHLGFTLQGEIPGFLGDKAALLYVRLGAT